MTKPIKTLTLLLVVFIIGISSCHRPLHTPEIKILFLHHSVGEKIWKGDQR
jgi:hypothetical protein